MEPPAASTSTAADAEGSPQSESATAHAPVATKGKNKRSAEDDDVDGADGDDGAANKKRRNRKPVTCAQCRRRKLKCDRGYPCGACRDRQESHLCEWEGAIRLPQPHLTRDAEAQELRLQLDRLENLLGALSGTPAAAAAGGAPAAGTSGEGVAEKSAAEALGLLAAKPPAHGANSGNHTIISSVTRAQILAQAQSVNHLVQLLPPRKELDALVNRFLASEVLFFPIVHVPTFQKRFSAFHYSAAGEDPFLLALLFAIASWEMGWQLTDPALSRTAGIEKENAMKRFFEAGSETLRMAGFMEVPTLNVIRTLLVLHHCASHLMDPRAGFLLSDAVQVAQTLGLNRDPALADAFDPIEVEERRRLWYILVALDWLDQSGRVSTVSSHQYDTQEPTNAFDTDITDSGVTARPFPTFTPALFLALQNQIGTYSHTIGEGIYSIKPGEPVTPAKLAELNAGLERMKATLPALKWVEGVVEPLSEENYSSDRFRVQAHSAVLQLVIRVNRPLLTRGCSDLRLKEGRDKTVRAAHQLLGIWRGYGDEHPISRLWSLTFHALNALCIIAIDLFQDPQGPDAATHRRALGSASQRFNAREHKSKVVQEVLRVVGVLVKHSMKPVEGARASPPSPAVGELDPNIPFSRSLPLPMTVDPFSQLGHPPRKPKVQDPELAPLWNGMVAGYKTMYAVPDAREWEELARVGERPWARGVDLVRTGSFPASAS
ncbi:hypothetical protein JCM1841_004641 [Sporobolomyces salmonicolor]